MNLPMSHPWPAAASCCQKRTLGGREHDENGVEESLPLRVA